MKQVEKQSGETFHFNIDGISHAALEACRQIHERSNLKVSNSVLVRRSLRVYLEHLQRLRSTDALRMEEVETRRAAKGVA